MKIKTLCPDYDFDTWLESFALTLQFFTNTVSKDTEIVYYCGTYLSSKEKFLNQDHIDCSNILDNDSNAYSYLDILVKYTDFCSYYIKWKDGLVTLEQIYLFFLGAKFDFLSSDVVESLVTLLKDGHSIAISGELVGPESLDNIDKFLYSRNNGQ